VVVLIAHTEGLVSLYAHLDDRIALPRVAAGPGAGPHLHFVVWRDGELIDLLSLVR
jgi:murein DD-endopeptidase MepM/ murein hydrolase activator NlpD